MVVNIICLVISVVLICFGAYDSNFYVGRYIDINYISFVVGVTFITLSLSGMIGGFFKAFKFAFINPSAEDIEKSCVAIKCAMRANILAGALLSFIRGADYTMSILIQYDSDSIARIFISFLPIITALFFNIVLNILLSHIEAKKYK